MVCQLATVKKYPKVTNETFDVRLLGIYPIIILLYCFTNNFTQGFLFKLTISQLIVNAEGI